MAVAAQVQVLNKEIEQLDKKIKELYLEKKSVSQVDKAELLQRITKSKAEKERRREGGISQRKGWKEEEVCKHMPRLIQSSAYTFTYYSLLISIALSSASTSSQSAC